MNNNTINTLSGAVMLPVFNWLHSGMSIRELRQAYRSLCQLRDETRTGEAISVINFLICAARIEIPDVYAEVMASPKLQAIFLNEFLADFEDILSEYDE